MPIERFGRGNHGDQERLRSSMTLEQAFIESTFAGNRAIRDGVSDLELGFINHEANDLMRATLHHPNKVEYGKIIYVTSHHRVDLAHTKVGMPGNDHGIGGQVRATVHIDLFPHRRGERKENRQSRFIATLMHTHGVVDVPPSPMDLLDFFLSDDEPNAETAVMVIALTRTPHSKRLAVNKYILFRGPHTPVWSRDEAEARLNHWGHLIHRRFMQRVRPGMSRQEQAVLDKQIQTELFREVVKHYDGRLYEALYNSSTAHLVEL